MYMELKAREQFQKPKSLGKNMHVKNKDLKEAAYKDFRG